MPPFDVMMGFSMIALGLIMLLPDTQRSKSNPSPGRVVGLQYSVVGVLFLMGIALLLSKLVMPLV